VPTTTVGLLLFVGFLTPGFLHYVQRRALVPQRSLSPLVETATLVTTSVATNAVVLLCFGLLRLAAPGHTPDVGSLLGSGTRGDYFIGNVPYVLGWGAGLLVLSSVLALLAARWGWFRSRVTDLFAPVIVDTSAWYQVFEERPEGNPDGKVYVGCDMRDGSYIAGVLAWYSTEVDETADRDFVLAPPLVRKTAEGEEDLAFERVILSARDVLTMYVTWLDDAPVDATP
jgi:hypothetical protein